MDESRRRPQVAIGHMWLKVSDISRAAQYFVSLGLRPIHQGQGIAVLELRGGTHLVLRPSDESIPAGTKAPFRLDGGRHRRHTRTIRAIGPEAVTPGRRKHPPFIQCHYLMQLSIELPDPRNMSADANLLVTEAMIACTTGMLLCLDSEQRLTYILGQIFGVTDVVAAEVLEVTCENFRQRLARARRDLRNFMNDKCGPVNRANPCRCAKKTRGFIEAGHVDPKNLLFTLDRICEVREAVPKAYETIKTLDDQCADIYRGHPFYKPPDLGQRLRQLVESPDLRRATNLS